MEYYTFDDFNNWKLMSLKLCTCFFPPPKQNFGNSSDLKTDYFEDSDPLLCKFKRLHWRVQMILRGYMFFPLSYVKIVPKFTPNNLPIQPEILHIWETHI